MSESGHHHGGDMGGQQGFSDPGFQPGMFPPEPHHHHHHIAEPSDPMPLAYGQRPRGGLRYRSRASSPAWVALWVVRLAVLAFIVYVAFQVFHGATSTPSP
jgi:hypothetical protein